MARIRSIKPDFWTDEKIVELDFEDRLLFIGLWNFADDQGYLDYSPRRIKMQVFPGDNVDVSGGLARLHEASLIALYDSPEGRVVHISNWERHQRVSNPSKPRFEADSLTPCAQSSVVLASPRESSRVIGKGREGKGVKTPSSADADGAFDEWWSHYPRKVGKAEARKVWAKAVKASSPEAVLEGLKRQLPDLKASEERFRPHPATWLRQGRWEDERTPEADRPSEGWWNVR